MATRRTLSFLFRMKKWVNIRPEWRQTFDALCESLGNVFPRTGLPSHDDDEDEKTNFAIEAFAYGSVALSVFKNILWWSTCVWESAPRLDFFKVTLTSRDWKWISRRRVMLKARKKSSFHISHSVIGHLMEILVPMLSMMPARCASLPTFLSVSLRCSFLFLSIRLNHISLVLLLGTLCEAQLGDDELEIGWRVICIFRNRPMPTWWLKMCLQLQLLTLCTSASRL